ncbi:MAG: hypothetical protein JWP74_298 [Marmoricola sp.]|nr:hypothetical protein [Marmoricola sp.]
MIALPRLAVLAVVVALGAGACTSSGDSPGTAATDQPPVTGTPAPVSTTPADGTSPSPTDPSTAVAPTYGSLSDRLLATTAVPGLTTDWHWQDGNTGSAGTKPFGPCAKVDLSSIGASDVVERTWFPPGDTDDAAAEQIAEFPDTATAARAAKVLTSWHDRCALPPGTAVGPTAVVPVPAGSASWYLVTRRGTGSAAESTTYAALGTAVEGTRIAIVLLRTVGRLDPATATHDPVVAMVGAAAGTLG